MSNPKASEKEEKEEIEVKNYFRKFQSLENHYQDKYINYIRSLISPEAEKNMILCEKIHGANFSFFMDRDGGIKAGKRSGIIEDQEKFYDWEVIYNKFKDRMLDLAETMFKGKQSNRPKIQVYGELYGGVWPSIPSKTVVQKEIYYSPLINFRVFDIQVEEVSLNYLKVIELCEKHSIPYCQIIKTGTLDELLRENPHFNSTIPPFHKEDFQKVNESLSKYGIYGEFEYQPLDDNWAEGYVISTVDPFYSPKDKRNIRRMIKLKDDAFNEKTGKGAKDRIKKLNIRKEMDGDMKEFLEFILQYINAQRLTTLYSKIGQNEKEQKVQGMLVADALKDAIKDIDCLNDKVKRQKMVDKFFEFKNELKILKKVKKQLQPHLMRSAAMVIRYE